MSGRRLGRAGDGRQAAPVRVVHLGLGSFARSHVAWYTDVAPDADQWGIAAFTGRSPRAPEALLEQDGLYTLLVRGRGVPEPQVVSSLSAVHGADDLDALRGYLARPEVAVVTITVTEAGYRADPGGPPATVVGRLVEGLVARRDAGAGPLALVPNDNLDANGVVLRDVVLETARARGGDDDDGGDGSVLADWIAEHVSFVSTVVDRITPATTDRDRLEVEEITGVADPEVVVTEPFTDWVLAGDFPAGRPRWEAAGARFVDDTEPFARRKLWLLNGAHTLLACAAPLLGHATVADAVADERCRAWVEQWWDAAAPHLPLPADEVAAYRSALLERFANPGIRHQLSQIAADGSEKMRVRAVPVVLAGLQQGAAEPGATRLVAAWVAHLLGHGVPVVDPREVELRRLVAGARADAVRRVLAWLELPVDPLHLVVEEQLDELLALAPGRATEGVA